MIMTNFICRLRMGHPLSSRNNASSADRYGHSSLAPLFLLSEPDPLRWAPLRSAAFGGFLSQSPLSSERPGGHSSPRSYGAGTVISLAEKIAHSPLGADELGVGRIVLDLLS